MAYKDSGEIANNSNYALGDYSFRIERSSVPGSTNDKIEAVCTQGGKNARKSIQIPSSSQLAGWYVEANDTEATVYATVRIPDGDSKTSDLDTTLPQPIPSSSCVFSYNQTRESDGTLYSVDSVVTYGNPVCVCVKQPSGSFFRTGLFVVSSEPAEVKVTTKWKYQGRDYIDTQTEIAQVQFSYEGKTVYYSRNVGNNFCLYDKDTNPPIATIHYSGPNIYWGTGEDAWTMLYGTPAGSDYKEEVKLVGRFAIEIEDAGGVGPGSDWTDPGDYDPGWEPDDPTHTLYVEVTGALSGRHNDPIEDPSYSYIPADKDTVKDYGCGGDGGHGGGGGAGASTVVIHKFATNQANSKEVTAIARRHGYGSGGGKGGKGGDGCILVYY